jgi:cytochrome c oxidase subunit 2
MVAVVLAATMALAACGDDGDSAGSGSAADGATLFRGASCSDCHSTAGEVKTGPPLDGIYGTEVQLSDGSTVTVDDDYLATSIRDPGSQVVEGFSAPMPDIDLSDDQVASLVAYIRSLSTGPATIGPATTGPATTDPG